MIKRISILFLFAWLTLTASAQNKIIKVDANNQPLNVVLVQLRDQYNFQFSYSDNQLSQYKITVSKVFNTKDDAVRYLLKDLPFQIKKTGEVYIIIPDKKKLKGVPGKDQKRLTGQVVEAGSFEPLPFSNILINNHPMVADVTGSFNYTASADSSFHVRISHLGYYICDTLLFAGISHQFELVPSTLDIPEVLIQNNPIEKSTMIGEKTGKITINPNIARFLPGQGDNSVFNLIRLMPGIQAAGEQSGDLLMWGSSEGQNQVTFDEFTLFGLKNYNDNISAINPFLVKNIEILKGGYEAKYGNRVGGIVNITGKNGNTQKPVFSLNVNPTTLNGMVEIPLFKKSSLLLAYRQTYYDLFSSEDFNIFAPIRPLPKNDNKSAQIRNVQFDMNVYPNDYLFRDLNLKYTWNFDNGDQFYVSMYGGSDLFSLSADATTTREMKKNGKTIITPLAINLLNEEDNTQRGISAFFNKTWNNKLVSKFVFSHSDFSRQLSEEVNSSNTKTEVVYNKDLFNTSNKALENSFRVDNILNLLNGNQLEFGAGFFNNESQINTTANLLDTLSIDTLSRYKNNRFYAYIHDNLPIGKRLVLKAGARINMVTSNPKLFFEPRLSATYKFNEQIKLNASWGLYNQFMYKIANVDKDQNYSYLWITSNKKIPVLNAQHLAGGINYFKNNLTINVETYYRLTRNLTQRVFEPRFNHESRSDGYYPYFGDSKTYGIDFYAKKDFRKHSVWASYTLSKALERFAQKNMALPAYRLAPQHQQHEFKLAALFNIGKFYLSANYVYGSGLEVLRQIYKNEVNNNVSYNRVDAAVTYRYTPKRFTGELGFSVMNLFDTQNLKYSNFKNIQLTPELGDIRIYSNAVPFTPTVFLKIVF
ncbi:MAG: TonB-dependent receptor plug domain-containing protein [Prolixibacteraceae bacterium]|nr:TonB-dependent receptor plug domain-containing protein [Prolixibacteraceae bacterium]